MRKTINILMVSMIVCGLSISCGKSSGYVAATPTIAFENSPTATLPPITATPVAVSPAGPKYDLSCWPVKSLQEAKNIQGSFVYTVFNPSTPGPNTTVSILALDVVSMKTKRIDNFGPPELYSPDFEKIAAQINTEIFIITPDDVQTHLVPSYSFQIDAYLTDGRIRLNSLMNDTNYEEGKGLDLKYYILDPTTGRVQKNTAFLPNYHESQPGDRTLYYSPDMKYVLYRSSAYETKAEFTLFDLEKNKVAWVGPPRDENLVFFIDSDPDWLPKRIIPNTEILAPSWKPNANMLTAFFLDKSTGQTKYYSISTEGSLSPIADFDMIDIVNGVWSPTMATWMINIPTWSANGRYLITWGEEKEGNSMYIWDSQENIVYKPCLPDEIGAIVRPRIMQYSDGSSFIVQLTFMATAVPEDRPFQGNAFQNYFLDPVQKVIYEVPDLNQMGSPLNTNGDEIKSFFGWMNWEIP